MIVKFFDWDQAKNVFCGVEGLKCSDVVVVDHEWGGSFLAEVLVPDKNIENDPPVGKVLRKAIAQDFQIILGNKEKERDLAKEIKKEIRQNDFPMKVVEAKVSIDGGCILIVFSAEGRVDFRQLVKLFSTKYQKIVRFQQIGSRDEARNVGGYGICGKEICCRKFSGSLKSISTEMARNQMISHRGSERLSGLCGRLMCCLAYEEEYYGKKDDSNGKKDLDASKG